MKTTHLTHEKEAVCKFWDSAACGEKLYLPAEDIQSFQKEAVERYHLEPYIPEFVQFQQWKDKSILEIGVGLGADHEQCVRAGAKTTGIDLTPRAIALTQKRLTGQGLDSHLLVADAEALGFPDETFDLVYSWGVIHHSPDTYRAVHEILRVLRPGGQIKIMIYHKWSLVGLMLWLRYGLLNLKPLLSLSQAYARHLESPGTKAYSVTEARKMFAEFDDVTIKTVLSPGDVLSSNVGQRHQGLILRVAKLIWPRWLIRCVLPRSGLFMLVDGRKPS